MRTICIFSLFKEGNIVKILFGIAVNPEIAQIVFRKLFQDPIITDVTRSFKIEEEDFLNDFENDEDSWNSDNDEDIFIYIFIEYFDPKEGDAIDYNFSYAPIVMIGLQIPFPWKYKLITLDGGHSCLKLSSYAAGVLLFFFLLLLIIPICIFLFVAWYLGLKFQN